MTSFKVHKLAAGSLLHYVTCPLAHFKYMQMTTVAITRQGNIAAKMTHKNWAGRWKLLS